MNTYGIVEVWLHTFLISVLGRTECSLSLSGSSVPKEKASETHWVNPKAGSGKNKMSLPLPGSNPGCRMHSVVTNSYTLWLG